jgi:hypothetical protein
MGGKKKMSENTKLEKLEAEVHAVLDGLKTVVTKISEIEDLYQQGKQQGFIEESKAQWVKMSGPSGDYEKAVFKDNETKEEFQQLNKELSNHEGKLSKDSFFFWTFRDGSIGRKLTVKK